MRAIDTKTVGKINVVIDLTFGKTEKFVIQINSDEEIIQSGGACSEGGYIVIDWNDGVLSR
jgi:hypothetical protein